MLPSEVYTEYVRVVRALDKEHGKLNWTARDHSSAFGGGVVATSMWLTVHVPECDREYGCGRTCITRNAMSSVPFVDGDWETCRRSALVNAYHEMFEIS